MRMKLNVRSNNIYSILHLARQTVLATTFTLLLSHCGPFQQRYPAPNENRPQPETITTQINQPADEPGNDVINQLQLQYQQWKGVPYRLGGTTKSGVDCSGFVFLTFKKYFGLTLPRSTGAQVHAGHAVNQAQLRSGDLVFFKTGFFTRHVGIYLDENQFLHASTSQGVTISPLDSSYWQEHFWQARRILSF